MSGPSTGRIEALEDSGSGPAVPAIQVTEVTVAYDAWPVLRSVSFELRPKQMLAIIGPNGAGKSTLLRAILGLQRLDYGRILVFGRPVRQARQRIAYIPQIETVDWDFPVTAQDVVLMGRMGLKGWTGRPNREDRNIAAHAMERVGMTDFSQRHIRRLSGGQQRRVFIARALAQQAELMLMDEPFASVDAITEQAILDLIDQLSKEGSTVVVVNHDFHILDRFARVLLLNQRVVAFGSPGEVVTEQNLQATYGGRLSLLQQADESLRVRMKYDDGHTVRTNSD
ncbi:MAG: metal ABC transporter ATP-binding protein [Phycisphaerae bacterium]|nr:metal ABC transporter ATP-binding protein [Phycisphaerae bacterium]